MMAVNRLVFVVSVTLMAANYSPVVADEQVPDDDRSCLGGFPGLIVMATACLVRTRLAGFSRCWTVTVTAK